MCLKLFAVAAEEALEGTSDFLPFTFISIIWTLKLGLAELMLRRRPTKLQIASLISYYEEISADKWKVSRSSLLARKFYFSLISQLLDSASRVEANRPEPAHFICYLKANVRKWNYLRVPMSFRMIDRHWVSTLRAVDKALISTKFINPDWWQEFIVNSHAMDFLAR